MKARRLLSLVLVLALFVQCVPAWAESEVVIEQAVELPFPTEPMPLVSLNLEGAVVVAYGERTGDMLPDGVTYEDGVLTLDSVDLPGGIWADGDLTIVVRGECKLAENICIENGTLRIIGEENGRLELKWHSSNNGGLELTDVEIAVPSHEDPEMQDAIWCTGNITAKNSKIQMPDTLGFYSAYGTMTFENCEIDTCRFMVDSDAPVGGVHFTGCEVWAHLDEMSLFAYAGPVTVIDTAVHTGSVWAEKGLTAVNSVFEDSRGQWYMPGDTVIQNCEVNKIGGIQGEWGMLTIENSSLAVDLASSDDEHGNYVGTYENIVIRDSQIGIVSKEAEMDTSSLSAHNLLVENSEIKIDMQADRQNVGENEYEAAILIDGDGLSEIVNSKIDVSGNWAGILVNNASLNVIASDVRAVGGVAGVFASSGSVSFTGGSLAAEGSINGVSAENGTLEFNGVSAELKGGYCAVVAETHNPDAAAVTVSGCDAGAEILSHPEGMGSYSYAIDPAVDPAIEYLANDGRLTVTNGAPELTLTPNGELFSVFRASQSECVMGSTASFVLSYFAQDAGEVRIEQPAQLPLLEGSVTVDGEVVSHNVDGSAICVPGVLPGQVVRFSATCAEAGEFELTASAGGEVLDSLSMTVKDFTLGLPSATARTTLSVSGVAVPDSRITFYDGGDRIGSAESNLAGDWAAKLTISDTVGEHAISARIETPAGDVIETEPETVTYDPETIEVLRLVMTNTIHGEQIDDLLTCETVFDFTTADVKNPVYSYFPEYPTFTFSAELSANAAPEKVGRVYVIAENYKGEVTEVDLTYNEFTGTWVGTCDFDEYSVPEVVRVAYTGTQSGAIQVGDAYVTYTLDADGGMTIGEDENAIRIVQRDNTIDITDMNGDGLRLLLVDESNMILSTTHGETLATVLVAGDSMTIESADKSVSMVISEDSLSLSDVVSGCTLFADETRAEMSVPDGGGNVTRYLSDVETGEKIEYPDGTFEQWQYAGDGLSATYTARDGSTISYAYDAEGNLTKVDGELTIEYGENEVRYTGADGETLVEMDESGSITRITYPDGLAVSYAYDADGNLTSVTDPMGNSTFYAYDASGNIVSVSDDNGVVAEYAYDENGNPTGRILANGVRTEYINDEAAQTSVIRNLLPDGSVQSEHVTMFDESGMAVAQSGSHGDWTFTYDENGQLLSMTAADGASTTYEYTPSGTIAAKTGADGVRVEYASNALNQITQMGDTAYEYDLNGQLVREVGPDGETAYEWDGFGRLVKATGADGSVYEYGYDAFGNRSAVTVNGETTRYIWNPAELPEIIGAILPDGSYVRYVQGNGLEAQVGADGAAYYQYDQLGSTVALTGADGQVLSSWAYNPIGEQVSAQETVTTPFGYVGQYGIMTDGNGLQYMRARYMHEGLSAFMSPDPAGQMYDENVYRYAGNNRVYYVDITGYWLDHYEYYANNPGAAIQAADMQSQGYHHWGPTNMNYNWLAVYVGYLIMFGPWLALKMLSKIADKIPGFQIPGWVLDELAGWLLKWPKDLGEIKPPRDPNRMNPYFVNPYVPPYVTPPEDIVPNMDPSGYVYEGATIARIEGVTATLYYKPTLETPDDQATVWNAEDYSQINPLITDAEGKYAWMTNTGWFKVVYEKEGYETAESEWLPVPPVQTEVNIAMTSLAAPTVAKVTAAGDRITIAFDKFMSTENMAIELNGALYDGEIIYVEQESGLVRKIALWRPDGGSTVDVSVSGAASYAGVEMVPFAATVEVTDDVRSAEIETGSIGYGSLETVRIRVLDSWNQPLVGAELTVENLTEDAVLLLTERVTTDEEGCAEVQLVGLTPAAAVLSVNGMAAAQLQIRNEDTSTGAYAEGLARDRQWRIDLHAEWTNQLDEPDELVEEYIGRFTAASEEIDASVEEAFMTELLAAWNQEIAELVKSRQNGLFTTDEILRLDEIIARRALYASALMN